MNSIIKKKKKYRPGKFMKMYWRFRNWFRDSIFEPIWYRFFGHKHHIIYTKLTPRPWYEVNTKMLYGVMGLVEWFVENDMRIWSQEKRDKELKRIREEENPEYQKDFIECLEDQFATDDKIISIYRWWKNYPEREKEIEKALDEWCKYDNKFREDPEDYFGKKKPMTEEEKKEDRRLLDYHSELEDRLRKEENEYLKLAVDLKEYMWS